MVVVGGQLTGSASTKITLRETASASALIRPGQSGNPAFLEKVYEGVRLEARLTGTEAPQKQALEGEVRLPIRVIDELYEDAERWDCDSRSRRRRLRSSLAPACRAGRGIALRQHH
jgi:hypothetical protein